MRFDDNLGFTYFQIKLHPTEEKMLVQTKQNGASPIYHIQLLNCATLLPTLWLNGPFPYAVLTKEGKHLNVELNFV
jgi:hypothetical protein